MKKAMAAALFLLLLAAGGLGARHVSAALLTPPPGPWITAGILAWLCVGALYLWALGGVAPLPRLARRLLAIAGLAIAGWSVGTLGRAAYALVAFAGAETTTRAVVGYSTAPLGEGAERLSVFVPEVSRSLDVALTADARESAGRSFVCVTVPVEETADGVARFAEVDAPLDASALVDCR